MLEEHKAVILQKYARAWLARRRFQSIRRFVLNIQLTYRVQRLQKKLEDQVGVPNESFILTFSNRCILSWASSLAMQTNFYSYQEVLVTWTLSWETEAHFKWLLPMVIQVVHCTGQLSRRAGGDETQPGSACPPMCSGTEMGCLKAGVPFLICTVLLSVCQARLLQGGLGSEELPFPNLPEGPSGLAAASLCLSHCSPPVGGAVQYAASRPMELIPGLPPLY